MPRSRINNTRPSKPVIFHYHDYVEYLKDWFAFQKASQSRFSLRTLSKKSGLSLGSLSTVISGTRGLARKSMEKLLPLLKLNINEQSYFELLYIMAESPSSKTRMNALERLQNSKLYQTKNPKEYDVYHYLTHWYYVAIREMGAMRGFKAEPKWIQSRLRFKVSLSEVKSALNFLISNGYLEVKEDGTAHIKDKNLKCLSGVYKLALTKFQYEMLDLAAKSIDEVSAEQRYIKGFTFSFDENQLEEIKNIIDNTIEKLKKVEQKAKTPSVTYHTALALFPLSHFSKRGES